MAVSLESKTILKDHFDEIVSAHPEFNENAQQVLYDVFMLGAFVSVKKIPHMCSSAVEYMAVMAGVMEELQAHVDSKKFGQEADPEDLPPSLDPDRERTAE